MINIKEGVINNLKEAADWLREAWAYEPYNIYYEEFGKKDSEYYIEYINIEPIKNRDDLCGWDIYSLEEFKKFIATH